LIARDTVDRLTRKRAVNARGLAIDAVAFTFEVIEMHGEAELMQ
jgi:hypothetical protein